MKGKTAKRAKIMLPKINPAASDSPTVPTKHIASRSDKPAVSGKPIFSSTLQDAPLPSEIRLVFESEFSTIREDGQQFWEREIPTFKGNEATLIQENFEVPLSSENLENANSVNIASGPKCQVAENRKKGCSVCYKSEPKETGSTGGFVMQRPKNSGGPFCSSFREDISHVQEKLQLGSENKISMVAGPSKKRYYTRSSVASNSGLNLLTTFPELDETNNLFGVGPPEEEIIKIHDSASQHEFRYYDGIRQRYCSSFKENGFDVPGIIRLPFNTNISMSTIVDSADEQQASDSFESDEETLQKSSATIDDTVDSMRNSNSMPPPLKTVKQWIRPSISCEPSHMAFNQQKSGPTLRPRKLLVGSIAEENENDEITLTGAAEADDKYYSDGDSEKSYEEAEVGMNKCAWMEEHFLSCFVCSSVDTDKCVPGIHDSESRSVPKTKSKFKCGRCGKHFTSKSNLNRHISSEHEEQKHPCSQCNKSFGRKGSLKMHLLSVHEGTKAFACSVCEKRFRQKGSLTVHLRIHAGLKPFRCNECPSAFTHKSSLTIHMRTHSKEKPFQCTFCHKKFSDKSNLRRHEKIHAAERETDSDSE